MEIQLTRLLDAIPGLVWTASPDGQAEHLGTGWLDYTGLSLEQAVGAGWRAAVHPEDRPGLIDAWAAIIASGRPGEAEARLRRFDGSYRWFLFRANPMREPSGKVVRWCGMNFDIEDRVRAENAEAELEQANRYLAHAQRQTRTGSFTADVLADEHIWSDELYRIFEFAPGSRISVQGVRAILHPEDLQSFDAKFAQSASLGTDFEHGFRIVTPSSAVKHLYCIARVIERTDGRPIFLGAIQDVTDGARAQEALRSSEADLRRANRYLKSAQRLSRTGSFTWDPERNELDWSDETYRIFEVDLADKPQPQRVFEAIHPHDLPRFEATHRRARETGEEWEHFYRIVTSRGVVKHLHSITERLREISDRPVFIGAVQDVTESTLAAEALNRARDELARVSRVLTLSALTASIAHEVSQPLSGIITNANTCLRMLAANPPNVEGARETARRTIRDGSRASEVIKRLRALFRKKDPAVERVDLNEAAQEVIAMSQGRLQANGVILRTELADDLPHARGDRVQLQQVILNLIQNASDAMSSVEDRPRQMTVRTERDGREDVRLTVQDAGSGFGIEAAQRLFDAFYTTKSDGMGIGLAVSRSIVERHGGRMWARVNKGPGASFSFSVPLYNQNASAVGSARPNAADRGST